MLDKFKNENMNKAMREIIGVFIKNDITYSQALRIQFELKDVINEMMGNMFLKECEQKEKEQ